MALFGVQIVITMIMASVLQKLSPQYSISRWIICKRLIRYLHPSDEELKSLAGISGKSFKGKGRREKWRNRNGSLDDGKDYEEFLVPKSVPVVLQAAPITADEALQLRFYTDYQWLMDFALHAVLVYAVTEAYRYYFPGREEINLSLVWCLLVLGFAIKVLFSLTALYFRGEEPIGERSLCLVSGFTFFVLAMVALIADEDFLEFGLRDAYRSFNESSHQFLQTQGLSSRLLLHMSFVSPLFVVLLWVKPLAREYFTERSFPGMKGNLISGEAFETSRIVLVLAVVVLRLCLMPRYLQSYLNLAPEKMAELRKEAGNISNIDLQRKVVRVFYYLCVVALQYITPLLTCAFTALLLKTLGGHSWMAYLWSPGNPGAPVQHDKVPGVPPRGPSPESILATSQQFSLTLAGLRAIFTPVLFRGVLSFMTWWLCATSFATSVVGLVYHTYTS
ncbi:transmembrane protein 161B isoform X2 [Rhipicephalus sanguineus]|uniref:transmembrane protein 161B isoform X2 n=1 Tax=Rhipicephalus sanguineus TaxID=34632 RepID=UPI00189368EC|nr:transmembrane protein 161B isoform X2 [Rhipicephalus sanguineus]